MRGLGEGTGLHKGLASDPSGRKADDLGAAFQGGAR